MVNIGPPLPPSLAAALSSLPARDVQKVRRKATL
jgi:hypothetical protein